MQIKDILNISNAKLIKGNIDDYLTNISKDTRTINKNDTYIAIKGEVYDGNTFYMEAIKKGAKTLILNDIINPIKEDVNVIKVDDTTEFLIEFAKLKRKSLNIPIIAVTGSVGKTSTKNIISDILKTKYKVLKTEGNLNTKIGLALTILSITNEEIAVVEMGMSNFKEISTLTNIAKPNVAVITNIGTAHIGNLGSRQNILKAKLEILEGLSGPIIINNDNDLLNAWQKTASIPNKIITFGIEENSDYTPTNIKYTKTGSTFTLNNEIVNINVLGKHFIYNSLVAFAIGDLYQVDHENIIKSLQNLKLEPHRMQLINKKDYTIIDDTYNASYDSVYYSLSILNNYPYKKIAILGDILELGEYGPEIHQNIGKLIVEDHIDLLLTVGPLAKYINEEAINNGFDKKNSFHFENNQETIEYLNNLNKTNSIILIKASHGMNFLEIVEALNK